MRQRVPIERFRIEEPRGEAHQLLLFAAGCSVVAAAAAFAIARLPLPLYPGADFTADACYVAGFKLGYMLGGSLLWLRWHRYRLADAFGPGIGRRATWIGVAIAVAAGLLVNAQHIGPIRDLVPGSASAGRLAAGVMLPLVAAAIPEELAFRVLLQTRLEKVHGRLVAIGVSTLLFALWHLPSRFLLSSGVEGEAGDLTSILIGTGAPVLVVGVVLAAIWDRWLSVAVLVALHLAIDILPSLRHALGAHF